MKGLLQHLEHAAAREARDEAERRQRQRDDGQQEMSDRTGLPTGNRQPVQMDAEKQRQKRQHHERGYCNT